MMKTKVNPTTGKKTRIIKIVKRKKCGDHHENNHLLNEVLSQIRHSVGRSLSKENGVISMELDVKEIVNR